MTDSWEEDVGCITNDPFFVFFLGCSDLSSGSSVTNSMCLLTHTLTYTLHSFGWYSQKFSFLFFHTSCSFIRWFHAIL